MEQVIKARDYTGIELQIRVISIRTESGEEMIDLYNPDMSEIMIDLPGIYSIEVSAKDAGNRKTTCIIQLLINWQKESSRQSWTLRRLLSNRLNECFICLSGVTLDEKYYIDDYRNNSRCSHTINCDDDKWKNELHGEDGTVECEKNVLLNQRETESEKIYHVVKFQIGDIPYKTYTILRDELVMPPAEPQMADEVFYGWKDSNGNVVDFTLAVTQDTIYYADFR